MKKIVFDKMDVHELRNYAIYKTQEIRNLEKEVERLEKSLILLDQNIMKTYKLKQKDIRKPLIS